MVYASTPENKEELRILVRRLRSRGYKHHRGNLNDIKWPGVFWFHYFTPGNRHCNAPIPGTRITSLMYCDVGGIEE